MSHRCYWLQVSARTAAPRTAATHGQQWPLLLADGCMPQSGPQPPACQYYESLECAHVSIKWQGKLATDPERTLMGCAGLPPHLIYLGGSAHPGSVLELTKNEVDGESVTSPAITVIIIRMVSGSDNRSRSVVVSKGTRFWSIPRALALCSIESERVKARESACVRESESQEGERECARESESQRGESRWEERERNTHTHTHTHRLFRGDGRKQETSTKSFSSYGQVHGTPLCATLL